MKRANIPVCYVMMICLLTVSINFSDGRTQFHRLRNKFLNILITYRSKKKISSLLAYKLMEEAILMNEKLSQCSRNWRDKILYIQNEWKID